MKGRVFHTLIAAILATGCDNVPAAQQESAVPQDQYASSGTVFFIEESELPKVIAAAKHDDKEAVKRLVNHFRFSFVNDPNAKTQERIWLERAAALEIKGMTADFLNLQLETPETSCDKLSFSLNRVRATNPDLVAEFTKNPRISACES